MEVTTQGTSTGHHKQKAQSFHEGADYSRKPDKEGFVPGSFKKLFFFQITMWYDKYFKNTTMTKYLMGRIPEVFLRISQTH